jgi:hypothetical protein
VSAACGSIFVSVIDRLTAPACQTTIIKPGNLDDFTALHRQQTIVLVSWRWRIHERGRILKTAHVRNSNFSSKLKWLQKKKSIGRRIHELLVYISTIKRRITYMNRDWRTSTASVPTSLPLSSFNLPVYLCCCTENATEVTKTTNKLQLKSSRWIRRSRFVNDGEGLFLAATDIKAHSLRHHGEVTNVKRIKFKIYYKK